MPTVTFTAISPEGTPSDRTTDSMPYVAVVFGDCQTWHKTYAAAHKAAVSQQHTYRTGKPGQVVPAVPTAINGKLGDWTPHVDGWGDIPGDAFAALVDAKLGKAAKPAATPKKTAAKKTAAPTETPGEVKGAWTADELAWVAANVDLPLDTLARTLSRSVNSVRHKVRAAQAA